MKNSTIAIGLFFMGIFLFSCKDKTAFTISGTVKNADKLKTVYLLKADSSQFKVIDSVKLAGDGSFEFKCQTPYMDLFKLKVDTVQFDIIAQNGNQIELNTDLADKAHPYTVSGSVESSNIKTFDDLAMANADKNNKIETEFQAKSQQTDANADSLLKIYMPAFQNNLTTYSDQIIKFGKEHSGSLAAFYALTSLNQVKYEQQLIVYADGLRGAITENPAVKQFIQTMKKAEPLSIGHTAPDFTINTINGKSITLSDYKICDA